MNTLPPVHRIALLFNGSKTYDRGNIAGIGNYLSGTRASWHLFLEEDFSAVRAVLSVKGECDFE